MSLFHRLFYLILIILLFTGGILLGFSLNNCSELKNCSNFPNKSSATNLSVSNSVTLNTTSFKPLLNNDKIFIDSVLRNDKQIANVLATLKEYLNKGDPSIIIAADRLNEIAESTEEELDPLPVSDDLAELKKAYLLSLSSMRKGSLDMVVAANCFMFGEQDDFKFYLERSRNKMKYAEDTRNYVIRSINYTINLTKTPKFQFIEFDKNKNGIIDNKTGNKLNLTVNITGSLNKTCNNTIHYKKSTKFFVDYPCNWQVFSGKAANTEQLTIFNPSDSAKFIIAYIIGQYDHTLDDFLKSRLNQLQEEKEGLVIKQKNAIKIGGQPAYSIIYTYNENGEPMTGGDILIKKDKVFYGLVFSFPDKTLSDNQKNVESLVNSFTFR